MNTLRARARIKVEIVARLAAAAVTFASVCGGGGGGVVWLVHRCFENCYACMFAQQAFIRLIEVYRETAIILFVPSTHTLLCCGQVF